MLLIKNGRVMDPKTGFDQITDLLVEGKKIVKIGQDLQAEDAKVAVRNIRRDVNEALKKEEKAKTITEDDAKDGLDQIQKLTDAKVKQIDELKVVKEKDVLEV